MFFYNKILGVQGVLQPLQQEQSTLSNIARKLYPPSMKGCKAPIKSHAQKPDKNKTPKPYKNDFKLQSTKTYNLSKTTPVTSGSFPLHTNLIHQFTAELDG